MGNLIGHGIGISSNSYSTPLDAGAWWTGTAYDVHACSSVVAAVKTDTSGILYMEFSPDGRNWDSSLSFLVASGVNEVHRLTVTRQYYRVRFNNTSNYNQTFFRLQSLGGDQTQLNSTLNSTIQSDADALITRGILMGQTDGGQFINVPTTPEGHLEVAVHGPRNPFGSIHVENLRPVFQVEGVYGINNQLIHTYTGLGGTLTNSDSQFIMSTNTSVGGNSTLQSRKRLRYRPGQGCVARFTALFDTGVANSFQVAGVGHPEDGLFFGYSGTQFGILHSHHGAREIQLLTLTSGTIAAGNVSINLNGAVHNIPVTNSTNNGYKTAYDISTGYFTGWSAEPTNSGVYFIASSVGNKTGPFLLTGGSTSASGFFTKITSGVNAQEDWVLQSQWNTDKLDGNGYSSLNLNPQRGNVYQIGYQYLGYGTLIFQVEEVTAGNNPDWVTVHTVSYPNSNTRPNFGNPSFPFTASAYSFGSTTNLQLKTASFAGFIEGQKYYNGPFFTYQKSSTNVSTSLIPLFTVKNRYQFRNKANQCVVRLLSLNAAGTNKTTSAPIQIFVIRDASLGGTPVFSNFSNDSVVSYDESATSVTYNDNAQLITAITLGETGQDSLDLEDLGIEIQPGESITIAARTLAGTASYVVATLNTREDQ